MSLTICTILAQVGDHHHTFIMIIHTFVIITAKYNTVVCGNIA